MNKIKYIVIVVFSIAIGVMIGIWIKPNPLATITIANISNKAVHSVNVTVGMTSYIISDIEQHKSKSVNVFVAGEAGYSIKVLFANGDTLVSWNYIETGQKLNESISDTSVVPSIIRQ
ncbi:MAG: hypothetical protein M0R68_14425 [Bacteroidetes bacterium]|nr:hypothetical protein [Bacteroidota bacterium]